MATNSDKGNVLVTGFGPFGIHSINASWEAVKLLPNKIDGYNIIKEEIPVAYDVVDKQVEKLWQQHKPELVIHVGVSKFANKLTLETLAYKEGYVQLDCFGKTPNCGNICAANCSENRLEAAINVQEICDYLNNKTQVKACLSTDAGRYLCEYIFFTSLSIDKNRTIFIHVPCLEEPYTAQELADGITEVIKCALKQFLPCNVDVK